MSTSLVVSQVKPLAVDAIVGNPLSVPAVLDGPTTQLLQDNYAWESCRFRLTGTLTLAGYSTAPTKYVESIENLMGQINIQATGKTNGAATNQLCSVDAAFLRTKTAAMKGTYPYRVDIGTANGAYNFESNFTRFFADTHNNRRQWFILNTALLNSLNIVVQWRDATAMVYGGVAGTATLSNLLYTLTARRYLNFPTQANNPYVSETQRWFNIQATTQAFACRQAPVGQILSRQWFKALVGNQQWADPSAALIAYSTNPQGAGNIQLSINSATTLLNQPAPAMAADNLTEWKLNPWPVGYFEYEPSRNGKLSNRISLVNVQNADNFVDVTFQSGQQNNIQITDEQLIGVTAAQWNNS
jgi:hypothetical protein